MDVTAVRNVRELGAAIRTRRKEKQLTQLELAQLCGTSLRFITELERGERGANVGKVLTICSRLALDVVVSARESTETRNDP